MSRLTTAVDRLAVLVVALSLLVAGVAAAVWGTAAVPRLSGPLDLGPASDATDKTWWPWVVGIGGLVLLVLGLRWLFAHVPQRGVGPVSLSGTDRTGRLSADGGAVASAAADELAATPGVRSARGSVLKERGQVVARLSATIDADADLALISKAADDVSADLRRVLGRDDLNCLVQLRLAARNRPIPRVH